MLHMLTPLAGQNLALSESPARWGGGLGIGKLQVWRACACDSRKMAYVCTHKRHKHSVCTCFLDLSLRITALCALGPSVAIDSPPHDAFAIQSSLHNMNTAILLHKFNAVLLKIATCTNAVPLQSIFNEI